MKLSKRPLTTARGRATLLFTCCLVVVVVYFLLARPNATIVGLDTQDDESHIDKARATTRHSTGSAGRGGAGSPASSGALQALSSILGAHTLLTGSVTDQISENPQESLTALLEEQERLKLAQSASKCDDAEDIHVDPLPGNVTGRFHGSCRGQYPPTVPNLQVRQIWKSKKLRKFTDVTLVTHLTLDQLPKLEYQCERWSSRVAAAIYVKLPYPQSYRNGVSNEDDNEDDNNDVDEYNGNANFGERPNDELVHEVLVSAEKELTAFFDKIHETQLPCTLDMVLAYEEYTSNDPWLQLYPINSMRNRALQLADAENVLVVDVDTVPNIDLSHDLHTMSLYETLNRVLGNRQVIVLPSLTVTSSPEDDPLQTARLVNRSLEGIERVKAMSEKGKIEMFRTVRSPLAQEDLDLSKWFNATMPFRLDKIHEEYEPVYMAKKASLPWYDERFRGLKLNRAVHTWHLHKSGFMFVVTNRAYVIHSTHPKGLLWLETRRSGHYKKITRMHGQALVDIEGDRYEPVTLFQCVSRRSNKWTWY